MKKIFTLITMLILSLSLFANEAKTLEIGDNFPNLTFVTLEGKEVTIDSLKGKNILLNFTASWCPFCKEEKIRFNEDYNRFLKDNKDLEILIVFGDYGRETRETTQEYIKETFNMDTTHSYNAFTRFKEYLIKSSFINSIFKINSSENSGQHIKNLSFYYDADKVVAKKVNLTKVPFNYYIDKTGKIIEITTYYYDLESLKPFLAN